MNGPSVVAPYAGQNQPRQIEVPATIGYREAEREEGCWVIPPYQAIYPEVLNAQIEERQATAIVPPPLSKTDLWSAQQTWPL